MVQGTKPEGLTEEARKARREYTKRYRQAHPEKARQWNANYWNRRASKAKEPPAGETAED